MMSYASRQLSDRCCLVSKNWFERKAAFLLNCRVHTAVRSRMGWCECARILGVESMLRICSQYYQIDC